MSEKPSMTCLDERYDAALRIVAAIERELATLPATWPTRKEAFAHLYAEIPQQMTSADVDDEIVRREEARLIRQQFERAIADARRKGDAK